MDEEELKIVALEFLIVILKKGIFPLSSFSFSVNSLKFVDSYGFSLSGFFHVKRSCVSILSCVLLSWSLHLSYAHVDRLWSVSYFPTCNVRVGAKHTRSMKMVKHSCKGSFQGIGFVDLHFLPFKLSVNSAVRIGCRIGL